MASQPLEELMRTINRVRRDDLTARVEFAKHEDDIGQSQGRFHPGSSSFLGKFRIVSEALSS